MAYAKGQEVGYQEGYERGIQRANDAKKESGLKSFQNSYSSGYVDVYMDGIGGFEHLKPGFYSIRVDEMSAPKKLGISSSLLTDETVWQGFIGNNKPNH